MVSKRAWVSAFGEETPYEKWQKTEGIPTLHGFYVEDLTTVPMAPWPRKGGKGSFINLEGSEHHIDGYMHEIPPGKASEVEKHMFDELIFVMKGRGATTVWLEGGKKQTFEWQVGSEFTIPMNSWHQHFNGQGDKPVLHFGATTAPLVMNYFHDTDFVFNSGYMFHSRYQSEEDFFSGKGKLHPGRVWETNLINDVYNFKLHEWKERGAGGVNVMFEFSNSTLGGHISEFPVGTYKKGHVHGPGAQIILLSGHGYSLLWPREGGEMKKVPWKKNSMFVPPNNYFHQHFNAGLEPARYLVFSARSFRHGILNFRVYRNMGPDSDIREGGMQVEYEDESPEIRRIFEAELAKEGLACKMSPINYRKKA
ncbi:MAG: ethanolamine ammonia lyase-activating protein [Dehalococcoidia bacterium]|nr:ethanolamine ammonia lyase-activating protein [Dehalococcoidia bacterium]